MMTTVNFLRVVVLLVLFASTLPMAANAVVLSNEDLTIDLSEAQISITTGFNGYDLSVFGMKRGEGDIAIAIFGPPRSMVVRRKDAVMGVWMNRESVSFSDVPVYYDVALSKPEFQLASATERMSNQIGLDGLRFQSYGSKSAETSRRFREALIRNKQIQGHFPLETKKIIFLNDDFFRADFNVPADVPTGAYIVKSFLLYDGVIKEIEEKKLIVGQVGLSARIYKFAHDYPFFYGLSAVCIALLSGFLAYVLLRKN